jgi:CarD family transcriptional regulator
MISMEFHVGDHVVHPQHGVGYVVKLEEREFEPGAIRRYYEISIANGSTVWVPMDLSISGLRKLTARNQIAFCRKILEARPSPLTEDARFRQSELAARLKKGTIRTQCEVVRDLYAYGEHRSLNGTIGVFYKAAQDVLCQEWALVEGIPFAEAAREIEQLLEKSRLTLKAETESQP